MAPGTAWVRHLLPVLSESQRLAGDGGNGEVPEFRGGDPSPIRKQASRTERSKEYGDLQPVVCDAVPHCSQLLLHGKPARC